MGYGRDQFQQRVDENLICPVCYEVLKDPWQCKDGHIFCRDCIAEWLKINQKCPMDNNPLQANGLVRSLVVKNMIENLNVYCHSPENDSPIPYRETAGYYQYPRTLRCDWTGKLESLEKHRETCPFQQVQCTNENCSTKIQRRQIEEHDKICRYKKVNCEKCGLYLIRYELVNHKMKDCPEVLVLCPNKCTSPQGQNNQIKRIHLNHHLTNICAKTIVDCPYKDQGCSVQVERQDVEKHVQGNMAAHMMLLAKQCSFLAEHNSSLTEQNSSLAEQCWSLTERCSSLTEQCSSLSEQCWLLSVQCSSHTNKNQALKDELKEVKAQLSSTNTYTWIIYDFPALCEKHPNGFQFRSPTFWLRGYKLCLRVYPNGINTDASGFISLFLDLNEEFSDMSQKVEVTKVSNSESALKFRMSLISQKPYTQDVSFDETHVFKEQKGRGWPKFVKRTDALSSAYCNRTNGSLTIKCTILLDKP